MPLPPRWASPCPLRRSVACKWLGTSACADAAPHAFSRLHLHISAGLYGVNCLRLAANPLSRQIVKVPPLGSCAEPPHGGGRRRWDRRRRRCVLGPHVTATTMTCVGNGMRRRRCMWVTVSLPAATTWRRGTAAAYCGWRGRGRPTGFWRCCWLTFLHGHGRHSTLSDLLPGCAVRFTTDGGRQNIS